MTIYGPFWSPGTLILPRRSDFQHMQRKGGVFDSGACVDRGKGGVVFNAPVSQTEQHCKRKHSILFTFWGHSK